MSGVYKVLIADITLSFDNVLGVAGAAKDHYFLLFFWFITIGSLNRCSSFVFCKIY